MAGEYDFLSPNDPFGRLPQDSQEAEVARARAAGNSGVGRNSAGQPNQAISQTTGQGGRSIPVYTPLSSYAPGLLDQAGAALGSDVTGMQSAANRQYVRNDQAGQGLLATADQQAGGILGESNRETNLLGGFSNELKGYGQRAVDETERNLQGLDTDISQVKTDANNAINQANAGVATGQAAVGAFNADVHAKIDGLVTGIDRSARDKLAMIQGGVGPDGQPMSASERWQMQRDTNFDIGQQTAMVTSQAWDQARDALAGLKMNLAGVQEQAGQTALGAGQLVKQAGEMRLEGGQQRLAADQVQQGYNQMRSQAMTLLTSTRASARALASQMRVAGMSAYADAIYKNPESVVSLFAGVAQMAALSSAPGARSLPGVNFG